MGVKRLFLQPWGMCLVSNGDGIARRNELDVWCYRVLAFRMGCRMNGSMCLVDGLRKRPCCTLH